MTSISYQEACELSDYLLLKGLSFCWLKNGQFIFREQCNQVIDDYNTLKN